MSNHDPSVAPRPTLEDWTARARAELRGADPWAALSWETPEGLTLSPAYLIREGLPPQPLAGRGGSPWRVRQEVGSPDLSEAPAQALEALGAGAVEVAVPLGGAEPAAAFNALERLAGQAASVHLVPGALQAATGGGAEWLPRPLVGARWGGLGLDPLGAQAAGVGLDRERIHDLAATLRAQGRAERLYQVDAGIYHEAGGSLELELAFALSTGLEYLRAMTARGLPGPEARDSLEFSFAISPRVVPEVARLRAFRQLWGRVLELLELSGPARVHGRSDLFSMAALDPLTNLVRTTLAAFIGGIGGCDALTVLPFDRPQGAGSGAGRRWARNQGLILLEEAGLHRVDDPGAGSRYLEALTARLAEEAWSRFQEVEGLGGMGAALDQGWPQRRVREVWEARRAGLLGGAWGLVGIHRYLDPRFLEPACDLEPPDGAAALAPGGGVAPLRPVRAAAAHERDWISSRPRGESSTEEGAP